MTTKKATTTKTDIYTKPALREKIKKKVLAGDKGGRAGQWSARKAQLVATEYAEEGGGYKGKKKKAQKSLTKWTAEKWRTVDGKKAARKTKAGKKTMARYLPDMAWSKLSTAEKKATDVKKRAATASGKQFVANTKKAKKVSSKT